MNPNITQVFFSPSGSCEKVSAKFAACFGTAGNVYDLLHTPPKAETTFGGDDLVSFTFPVFSGRLPALCSQALSQFKGTRTKAVAIVVYGNREYDDALLELCDILQARGFDVVAAAAFVAQHSIFTQVAKGRPDDDEDAALICQFAEKCRTKIMQNNACETTLSGIKGNHPYRNIAPLPIKPWGNAKCIKCNACANICPVKAIAADDPQKTNADLCIRCTACIHVCPVQARQFYGLKFKVASKVFAQKNRVQKQGELFF